MKIYGSERRRYGGVGRNSQLVMVLYEIKPISSPIIKNNNNLGK